MKNIKKLLGFLMLCLIISLVPTKVDAAVNINVKSKTITVGDTFDLKINGTSAKVTWTSSDKKIATVSSSGKVKGVGKGTATITGKVNGKSYSCKVGVRYKTTIKKQTISKVNNVNISVMSFTESATDYTLKCMVENSNSSNVDVYFISTAINGLMHESTAYYSVTVDVPAGKKGMMKYVIDKSWLKENNISYIKYISFTLKQDFDNDVSDYKSDVITLKTNLYDKVGKYKPSGKKIYSDSCIDLYYTGRKDNNFSFLAYSKINAYVTFENCSVNDWSYDITSYTYDLYSEGMLKNTYKTFVLSIDSNFIEEYDIDEIKNIEFTISLGYKINTDKIKLNF